MSKIIAN